MQNPGVRVYKDDESKVIDLKPREYMLSKNGSMYFRLPEHANYPWLCSIYNKSEDKPNGWTVTENSDGTITATPSILVSHDGKQVWHGYLTNGIWVEC